jgi:hypothetical protein
MEVVNIPQQRENILNILDDTNTRIEVVVMNTRQQQNVSSIRPRGKVPPFYISIENHDFTLHNCLVDSGATNNIMPLSVMEALGMGCTKYYEIEEIIYVIDSRKVPMCGEIKYFCAWISVAPHITIVFTIIVVDLVGKGGWTQISTWINPPSLGSNGIHRIEFPHQMRKFLLNLAPGEPLALVQELPALTTR